MSGVEQQPLYVEGWRDTQDHMRRPGETDGEFTHRQLDQARAQLSQAKGRLLGAPPEGFQP